MEAEITEAELSELPYITIGTKGLRKKIIKKGVSWQTPIPGDEVEVHYRVKLEDGEYFDSSREKGTTFRFKLDQGEVIKGWDEGIVTMRKGERSIFTVPSELAYGEEGSSPYIPPKSTLIFDIELISWHPIRDITGNGGILKKILREGEGWATPNDADEVLVKYVAKYENDEAVFSRSDEGVEFSLTKGHLCPAMSRAAKTMRKGEIAELQVKFSYGIECCDKRISTFDSTGPPYPNLIINLELVSWKPVIDIRGDNKILKKITKMGEAVDRPNEGSLAKVIYTGKLEDGTVFEKKGSDEDPFEYMCAEENINEALDAAIMSMKKGEEATVQISSLALNNNEAASELSSSASVLYEIKLIDFIKEKPFWKMDAQERIAACEAKKEDGNALFKQGKFQFACKKYEKAYKYIEYSHSFSDEEKLKANSLRLSCYLNTAACMLKQGEFNEVSKLCTNVLELDPDNVKALYRRAHAYLRTLDLDKAEDDINRALSVDPGNKDLKMKRKELKETQKLYEKHEAKIFSTMISRIS